MTQVELNFKYLIDSSKLVYLGRNLVLLFILYQSTIHFFNYLTKKLNLLQGHHRPHGGFHECSVERRPRRDQPAQQSLPLLGLVLGRNATSPGQFLSFKLQLRMSSRVRLKCKKNAKTNSKPKRHIMKNAKLRITNKFALIPYLNSRLWFLR